LGLSLDFVMVNPLCLWTAASSLPSLPSDHDGPLDFLDAAFFEDSDADSELPDLLETSSDGSTVSSESTDSLTGTDLSFATPRTPLSMPAIRDRRLCCHLRPSPGLFARVGSANRSQLGHHPRSDHRARNRRLGTTSGDVHAGRVGTALVARPTIAPPFVLSLDRPSAPIVPPRRVVSNPEQRPLHLRRTTVRCAH
jgi:hypothetical protein